MSTSKIKGLKNLLGVCLSFIGVYGPYVGTLYLQSSINSEGGLGLSSAVTTYASKATFLFFVPIAHSRLGSKYSLIIGYILFFVYGLCNFYPSWYTLIPGSVVMGIALDLMFVNSQTHCSETAAMYAHSLGETSTNAIALFMGAFGASIKLGTILGSLISSSILFNVDFDKYINRSSNSDGNDNLSCDNTGAAYVEQDYLYYVLISIFIVIAVIGTLIAAVLMDSFKADDKFQSFSSFLRNRFRIIIVTMLKLFFSWKMLLLFPLFVVNGISLGFIAGTFQKVFVSDCLGVQWIGFVVIVYSIFGVTAGIVFGRLHRYVPEWLLISIGIIVGGGLTMFLIFWNREPSYYAVFCFAIGWGICDGVWQSLVSAIVASLFPNETNIAFTIFEFGVSLGFVSSFASGLIFSTLIHLWIIFAVIAYSCISYFVLVCLRKFWAVNSESSDATSNDSEKAEEIKELNN